MKIGSLVTQSLRSISANKVRSILTILGIVIGIAAVISLVGLGKGLQSAVTGRISNLGTTDITIQSQDPERQTAQREGGDRGPQAPMEGGGGFSFRTNETASITQDEYEYIKKYTGISQASPSESTQVAVTKSTTSDTASQYQLYGVDVDYLEMEGLQVTSGVSLTKDNIDTNDNALLIGADAAKELFGDESPIGKTLYLNETAYLITGEFEQLEGEQFSPMPGGTGRITSSFITGYKKWLVQMDKEMLSTINARVENESIVESVSSAIETALYESHDVTTDTADISVTTSEDLLDTANEVATSFTTTLIGIAAISLLVGGIGIMNIMLVTVTERTREIGLRRALGAKRRQIVYQFIIEAVLLTLIGGLVGVAIGVAFGSHITDLIGVDMASAGPNSTATNVVIDMPTIMLSVAISSLIGVVFGLFPAIKASRLDPVEALRYE